MLDRLIVAPGSAASLSSRTTDGRAGLGGKAAGVRRLAELVQELSLLHNRLFAEGRHSALLVLQGLDAAGKDGTIRSVLTGVNPQGCRIVSFKAPEASEAAHDYLWRVHAVCPRRGEIGIFDRSHYEDVVAVRVHGLAPKRVWSRRPRHIREFERMLAEEGTSILKVFLQVSRKRQGERLRERLADPEKTWKFARSDLEDRARWEEFMAAYEDVITATSTKWAPWYIVPADHNWVRNLAVAEILVDALRRLDPQLPSPAADLAGLEVG